MFTNIHRTSRATKMSFGVLFCVIIHFACCSSRSMKTPAWSRRPSKVELTASTPPTCQPRDSSSRRHLGYSGVLFTMQHSVQHKKIRRERARESESVRDLIHCAWLVGSMAASYLREMCGFHLAFQGNQPK